MLSETNNIKWTVCMQKERSSLLKELKDLREERSKLQADLEKYRECDPEVVAEMSEYRGNITGVLKSQFEDLASIKSPSISGQRSCPPVK